MATGTDMSVESVKSCSKGLEISPSKSSASSPIAHGGSKAHGKGAKATGSKLASAHSKKGH
jgi:hypothetical protein